MKKKIDPALATSNDFVDEKIKDTPIFLPDGVKVEIGMAVFTVLKKEVSAYPYKSGVKSFSGGESFQIVEHKVIGINPRANSRSFTVRSDRGCEATYTVKNNCLPEIFGKRSSALAKCKDIHFEDIVKLQKKIAEKQKAIDLYKGTIAKLKKVKIS